MKNHSTKAKRRIALLAAVILLVALTFSTFLVSAREEEKKKKAYANILPVVLQEETEAELKGYFFLGGGGASTDGNFFNISGLSAGRAAEYNLAAESSALIGLMLEYNKGKNYFHTNNLIFNADEFESEFLASAARQVLVEFRLNRFEHRLDNDLMTDWTLPFEVDPGTAHDELTMRLTVLNSKVRYKPESIPSTVLFLHTRIIARDGDRQVRTMDHCGSCHVSTQAQGLDQRTLEVVAGAEYSKAPFAVRYQHEYRSYDDSSDAVTAEYANIFGNFELEGVQPFAVVPGNSRQTDIGTARYDLGHTASALVRFRRSDVENDNTGNSLETNVFSGSLNLKPVKWFYLKGRFDYWDTTNTTPFSAQRETTRFTGSATLRPVKELKLEGRYRYNKRERAGGTEVDETTTESFRIKAVWKPDRRWHVTGSHTFVDRENPFGRGLRNSFSRIDSVLLTPFGTDEDITKLNVIYCPTDKTNFTVDYYRSHSEGDIQDVESTMQNFSLGANYFANEKITVYGNYSYFNNEYEKEVYLGVLAPFLTITPLPYEGEGTTFSIGAWLAMDQFTLRPAYHYTTSESFFSDQNIGAGIVSRNDLDLTINRFEFIVGVPVSQKFDVNFGYFLDDYEDSAQPQDNGKIQWYYGWFGYKF